VTAAIKQVAEMYDVRPISGTLMHQMKQYVIDGKKMILLKELEPDQQKVTACVRVWLCVSLTVCLSLHACCVLPSFVLVGCSLQFALPLPLVLDA
jgi:hypothetical protein